VKRRHEIKILPDGSGVSLEMIIKRGFEIDLRSVRFPLKEQADSMKANGDRR